MALLLGHLPEIIASCRFHCSQRNSIQWSRLVASRQPACVLQARWSSPHLTALHPRAKCRTHATDVQASTSSSDSSAADSSDIGIHEVEELRGVRANLDGQEPVVEYRVSWKDGSPDTWELASNLSPDLIRDFDERWWAAAKKGDVEVMTALLRHSKTILSQVVDENRRSALHFVSAIGNVKCVKLLVDAGADLNLQDREGYTPLHMACGYMQTGAMGALLEAGADPLIKDKQGRDVVLLVDNLRKSMPPNVAALQRIMALEQVAGVLTDRLYEEVEPGCILDTRTALEGEGKEYLVQYKDDTPDEWVHESLIASDLVEDWSAGLERAPVAALLDVQQWGTSREYLVQWADVSPASWESEDNIPPELVEDLQRQQPQLFKGLKLVGGRKKRRKSKAKAGSKQQQQQQHVVAEQAGSINGISGQDSINGHTSRGSTTSSSKQVEQQQQREQVAVGGVQR